MLSPLIGGVLAQWVNWHAALLVLALFGAATLAFVAARFEETAPRLNPQATQFGTLLRNWTAVAQNPTFRAWVALLSLTYGGLFLFLAGSSFVFIEVLHMSRFGYGLVMASNSVAYIAGTWLCRRLLLSHGLRGAVRLGGILTLGAGIAMAGLSLAGVHAVWAVLLPQWVYSIGHGIHQPCGQAGAVGPFPDKAGAAAALSGFTMMLMSFAVGLWLGRSLNGTVYPLTLGIAAFSAGVALVAWTLVQRHGEPRIATAALPT
jgi:DHA1 family bicyclomycin/chloramphenicol resistance-like MFS transporter